MWGTERGSVHLAAEGACLLTERREAAVKRFLNVKRRWHFLPSCSDRQHGNFFPSRMYNPSVRLARKGLWESDLPISMHHQSVQHVLASDRYDSPDVL